MPRESLSQLIRYGMTGAALATIGQATYYALAASGLLSPLFAIAVGTIVALCLGYVAHGWFSFKGHGDRSDHKRMGSRFLAVNFVGYLLNSFWVWMFVNDLGYPEWVPIIPNVTLTPILTFLLHRNWTYR